MNDNKRGFRTLKGKGTGVSFKDVPCLINKQYHHRTLGELVKLYHMTGEIPPVGQRNGVYLANDIDSPVPTTGDDFEDIIRTRAAQNALNEGIADVEAKMKEAYDKASREKDEEIARLKAQLSHQNPVSPSV